MRRIFFITLTIFWLTPLFTQAASLKNTYPRLANYFLKWEINDDEAKELAKWDLLVLDMETQENSRSQILKIRELNPQIIILAYLTSQEIIDDIEHYHLADLRKELSAALSENWWLRDGSGQKISNWPYTSMLNLSDGAGLNSNGQRFNDYLPEFVVSRLQASGLWDGVFYDNTWGDIAWINGANLDLDNDGQVDEARTADRLWAEGFKKMLTKTRQLAGPDFLIVGNGRVYDDYQGILNGMMLESFPSSWEEDGTWAGSMRTYLKLPALNFSPSLPIINVNEKAQDDYQKMRFGLASTLLGQGFYSYDYDITDHGQTWWYDEYNVNLGPAQSAAYNLLASNNQIIAPGLWRRNFKNGVVIINSSDQKQVYVLNKEELEKINGSQDSQVNNGERINYFILEPRDGLILLKSSDEISNSPFTNGYFYRVFSLNGKQVKNGFFAYDDNYSNLAQVIIAEGRETLESTINVGAAQGKVNLYRDGQIVSSFSPFGALYQQNLSLAAKLEDGYFKQFVLGAGLGGGPQISIFNPDGRLIGTWFAYNKNLRGGVNVTLADVNGDGREEIITAPGPGSESLIKIFDQSGRLLNSFLAYDAKFRGGVKIAAADLNGNGRAEIVTVPASGGGPHVLIFNEEGRILGNFFAYDRQVRGEFDVSLSDLDNDNRLEILVGIKNF